MALTLRCYTGVVHSSAGTSLALTYSSWTNPGLGPSGTAPQAGDVILVGWLINTVAVTASQTGGTGTFTVRNDANTGNFATALASSVMSPGDTAPTFTFSSSTRLGYYAVALAPDSGTTGSVDQVTLLTGTTSGTTFTPPAATCSGSGEVSLLFSLSKSSANAASNSITTTPPTLPSPGWTALADATFAGSASAASYSSELAYQTGVSGTLTPGSGSETIVAAANSNVHANIYHVLVRQTAPSIPVPLLQSPAYAVQRSVTW